MQHLASSNKCNDKIKALKVSILTVNPLFEKEGM
jgi:hypothetical protein